MGRKKKVKIAEVKEAPKRNKEIETMPQGIDIPFGVDNILSICSNDISKVSVRALEGEETVLITLQGKIHVI